MQVTVHLDGAMGKEFGKRWKLFASTPAEVLSLIEANTGRLRNWIRSNVQKYANYRVVAVFKNGKKECLTKDTFFNAHEIESIRFTPLVQGAGKVGMMIAGAVLMVAAIWLGPVSFQLGLSLFMGGVSQLLAPKQKTGSTNTSHYFQGVGKNQMQGDPVPLIYGRCKVGGVAISKRLTVNSEKIDSGITGSKDS